MLQSLEKIIYLLQLINTQLINGLTFNRHQLIVGTITFSSEKLINDICDRVIEMEEF